MKTGATRGWAVTQQQCCRLFMLRVSKYYTKKHASKEKIRGLSLKYVSKCILIGCLRHFLMKHHWPQGVWEVLCNRGWGEVADVLWNVGLCSSMELIICVCWQHTQRVSLFNKHLVHSREDVLMRLYTLTDADWLQVRLQNMEKTTATTSSSMTIDCLHGDFKLSFV